MPARVNIPQRIVQAIAVPVKALGIEWCRHYGIRADKPPYGSVIVPCIIVVQPGGVKPLAGELFISGHGACARAAAGVIRHGAVCRAVCVTDVICIWLMSFTSPLPISSQ